MSLAVYGSQIILKSKMLDLKVINFLTPLLFEWEMASISLISIRCYESSRITALNISLPYLTVRLGVSQMSQKHISSPQFLLLRPTEYHKYRQCKNK